jgi:5S rRNA maturation endonuclease (ribonuclease M5)
LNLSAEKKAEANTIAAEHQVKITEYDNLINYYTNNRTYLTNLLAQFQYGEWIAWLKGKKYDTTGMVYYSDTVSVRAYKLKTLEELFSKLDSYYKFCEDNEIPVNNGYDYISKYNTIKNKLLEAQKKLLDTFERFVADDKKPLKLLYTTHSHHMINPKWLEGAFVVRNEAVDYSEPFGNRKVTNITAIPYKHFVAEYPDQQDYFQPILDTLEYQPGLLEKVPNVIITEGKNDYYTLRYVNEVLLKNKYKKIRFLPGIGCNKNHAIIQLYMGWNKSFMVLLDADKAGKKAAKEYLSTFGDIIIPSIKTYKDFVPEIEDVAMENIFTGEEKLAITQRFNETATEYKKSEFNTAIQTALINKEVIELSEETLNKFDNLLKQLNSYKFA